MHEEPEPILRRRQEVQQSSNVDKTSLCTYRNVTVSLPSCHSESTAYITIVKSPAQIIYAGYQWMANDH